MFVAQCCSDHHPNKLPMFILICCKLRHDNDLVGGFNPSEKYEFVSWDDDIPNIWKKCSKPPTSDGKVIITIYGFERLC